MILRHLDPDWPVRYVRPRELEGEAVVAQAAPASHTRPTHRGGLTERLGRALPHVRALVAAERV